MKLLIERYLAERQREMEHELAKARKERDQANIDATLTTWAHHRIVWDTMEKILFAPSTISMLFEEMRQVNDISPEDFWDISRFHSAWIGFQYPVTTGSITIHAMLFTKLYDAELIERTKHRLSLRQYTALSQISRYQDLWSLDLIDKNGTPIFYLAFHPKQKWMLSEWHHCPSGLCRWQGRELVQCEECQALRPYWGMFLGLAMLIRERYFAEEVVEEVRYHDVRRVPRKEKPKKSRSVEVAYVFRLIDASVRVIPLHREKPLHPRGSWILAHASDEMEQVERTVKRTYRHSRYVNVRGTTQEVIVKRSVLKDREERRITKVIASKFE